MAGNKRQDYLVLHRQRGAVAVFVAIALTALLIGTMLAIETGRVYTQHRQLQKAATLAALDASRVVSGCSTMSPTQDQLNSAMNTSLARNGFPATALTAAVAEGGTIQTNASNIRYLQPGSLSNANGARVTLTAPFPQQFIPLFSSGGTMRVSATATQQALGSLTVGTGLLGLNNGITNSLLSALLGGSISLSAASYQGLANTAVNVGALATSLGVGVKDLSNPVSLGTRTPVNILNGLASALSGTANQQVIDTLKNLAGQTTNNTPIPLGNILGPVGNVASSVPLLNLGDLIGSLALATRADSSGAVAPIELTSLPASTLLSTAGVTTKLYLKVLEAPKFSNLGRPGQTSATSAQVRLMVRLQVSTVSSIVSAVNPVLALVGLGGILYNAPITVDPIRLGIDINVAKATGYLDRIDCPKSGVSGGNPTAYLSAQTGVATVSIGTYTGSPTSTTALATTKAPITALHVGPACALLCIIPLGTLSFNVNAAGPVSANVGDNTIRPLPLPVTSFTLTSGGTSRGDLAAYVANGTLSAPVTGNPQTVSSGGLLSSTLGSLLSTLGASLTVDTDKTKDSGLLNLLSSVLASLVNTLVNAVTTLLAPVLTSVGGIVDVILDPLLQLLGVSVGRATVEMNLVTTGQPYIVTTALP